jgi:hypothetical protein
MAYELQYKGAGGWWRGASAMEIPDVHRYVAGVNANARPCRAIDCDTGEIIGEPCPICDAAHLGPDGSCLL